jgi:GAF domain-containing protein
VTDARPADDAGRERALDAVVAVGARLAAAERLAPDTGEPTLRAIAEAGVALVRVTAASIALHDPASGRLVFRAAAGPEGDAVVGLSIAAHEGIAGYVFATGQALAVADVVRDPRFERTTAERTGYVPRALLAVPLVDANGIVGVMELLDRQDGSAFDLADMEVATRLASAATAIARAGRTDREATELLRSALVGLAGADDVPIDALVSAAAERLGEDEPLWRLADRIARLRGADADDVELAIDWLDALLARSERRPTGRRRHT